MAPQPLPHPVALSRRLRVHARWFVLTLTSLLIICLSLSTVFASFEELPTGGRAAGLGNAFTGIADDVYSIYYNPAGLVQLHRSEFTAYYSKLYAGLSDGSSIGRSFVAYAHPMKTRGTFGISYLSLSLADLYSESTVALSYAHALGMKWNLGGNLKFLRKSFGSDTYTQNAINSDTGAPLGGADPLFAQNGSSKSGMAVDLGAQYRLSRIYGIGITILNMNSPNMALSSDDSDPVSAVYKVGLARRTKTSAVDAEFSMQKFTQEEFRLNIGGERWFGNGLGVRGGLGFGQRGYQLTSIGFAYRWESLQVDYALIYPLSGIKGTFGTHQVSMTFRFGRRS
ncbi:MAG: type IX secretion system membrane protein PorP/SprF [Elusimicrobiota bacterium]